MGSGSDEDDEAGLAFIHLVSQQKIAADMALAMANPFALKRVIKPFRSEPAIVGDQRQHGLF